MTAAGSRKVYSDLCIFPVSLDSPVVDEAGVLVEVESKRDAARVAVESGSPRRSEVLMFVHFDEASSGSVNQVRSGRIPVPFVGKGLGIAAEREVDCR